MKYSKILVTGAKLIIQCIHLTYFVPPIVVVVAVVESFVIRKFGFCPPRESSLVPALLARISHLARITGGAPDCKV